MKGTIYTPVGGNYCGRAARGVSSLGHEEMRQIEAHRSKDRPTPWAHLADRYGVNEIDLRQMYQPANDHDAPAQACERSVVFASLASMVEPTVPAAPVSAVKETHDLVAASAAMCPLAVALDPSKPETVRAFAEGLERVQREAADLTPIALAPTLRAV